MSGKWFMKILAVKECGQHEAAMSLMLATNCFEI